MEFVDFDTVSSKTNQFINERKKRMETEMKLKKLIALIEKTGLEVSINSFLKILTHKTIFVTHLHQALNF